MADAYEIAIKFNDGFHWRSMTSNQSGGFVEDGGTYEKSLF